MSFFEIKPYTDINGKPAVSFEVNIRDMARARRTTYPKPIKTEALRLSRPLANALEDLGRKRSIERHLIIGQRLDPRKRHAVGTAMRRGYMDPAEILPYQRRTTHLHLPSIYVLASTSPTELHGNHRYVQRVTKLALSIAWACESVGATVRCSLIREMSHMFVSTRQSIRTAHYVYRLIDPDVTTPFNAYGITESSGTLWDGMAYVMENDREALRQMYAIQGSPAGSWGSAFPSNTAGLAVQWARHMYAPDIVIAISNIGDRDSADIYLPNRFKVDQAINSIVKQIQEL